MTRSYRTDISPLNKRFLVAAVMFLVSAMICVGQIRSRRLLEKTRDELLRAKAGFSQLQQATKDRRNALETLKSMYAHGAHTSAERIIYGKIDELNALLRPSNMTISTIERKGDEVSLQYSFKFVNPDYNDFLNNIGYLEGSVFPLTVVSAVAIMKAEIDGRSVLSCSIDGKVMTSDKGGP